MVENILLVELSVFAAIAAALGLSALVEFLKEVNYLLGVLRWHRDRLHTTELIIIETGRKTHEEYLAVCRAVHGHSEVVAMTAGACAAAPHLIPEPDPFPTEDGTKSSNDLQREPHEDVGTEEMASMIDERDKCWLDMADMGIAPQELNQETNHEILPNTSDPLGPDRSRDPGPDLRKAAVDTGPDRADRGGDGHEEELPTDGSRDSSLG